MITDERPSDLRRVASLVGVSIFITEIANHARLGKIPLQTWLKGRLHLDPETMAVFFAVAGVASYLKPLAGILSDHVPFLGSRRRSYLLLSASSGAVLWAIAALLSGNSTALLLAMATLNVAAVLGNAASGGVLVDAARRHDAADRLSALRMIVKSSAGIVAGLLGGLLATRAFGWTCGAGALLMLMLFVLSLLFPRDREDAPAPARSDLLVELRETLSSSTLWSAAAYSFLFYVTPGVDTLLYYHQQDRLDLGSLTIGALKAINLGAGALAVLYYVRFRQRMGMRTLLYVGVILYSTSSLFYLGYRFHPAAFIAVEAANGFVGTLGLLPVNELAVHGTLRGAPRGSAALGYTIIIGIGNLGVALSEVLGTWIAARFALSFMDLVWVSAATSLIAIAGVPILPRGLVDRNDGEM